MSDPRFPSYRSTSYWAFNAEDFPCAEVVVDSADPGAVSGRRSDGIHIESDRLYVHVRGLGLNMVVGDLATGRFVPLFNPAIVGSDPLHRKFFSSELEARRYGFLAPGEERVPVQTDEKKKRARRRHQDPRG